MRIGLVECYCMNDHQNLCVIESDGTIEPVNLYWSFDPQGFIEENFIGQFSTSRFTFPRIQTEDRRVYYHLEFKDETLLPVGERILKIDGMYNFRDMGGYPTLDSKRVKWGVLYRGDQLYNLEESGKPYVDSLGIKTVIDFRSQEEIDSFPNGLDSKVITSHNFDPNAHLASFAGSLQNNEFSSQSERLIDIAKRALQEDPEAGSTQMIEQQKQFVTTQDAQEAFKKTMKVFGDSESQPLFQHCKGGKDRTGFAALMQLAILGVEERYLIHDYMLTNVARSEKNKRYYDNFLRLTGKKDYANYFYALFDVKESYIKGAIDTILKDYESLVEYAKDIYDFTDEDIERIRSLYLE